MGDTLVPVEYKIGRRHGRTVDVQVAAQALCLDEMTGQQVRVGAVWFAATRRREEITIDDELRHLTLQIILEVRALFDSAVLPAAPNDARCGECQLLGHCLPGLVADPDAVLRYLDEVVRCES